MKTEGFGVWGSKLRSLFDRYKFVLVVILAGVVLLLLPSFGGEKRGGGAVESSQESGSDPFQVEELERKLWRLASMSTATLSYTALAIWQATYRLQISL